MYSHCCTGCVRTCSLGESTREGWSTLTLPGVAGIAHATKKELMTPRFAGEMTRLSRLGGAVGIPSKRAKQKLSFCHLLKKPSLLMSIILEHV